MPDRPRNRHAARHHAGRCEFGNDRGHVGKVTTIALIGGDGERVVNFSGEGIIDAHLVYVAVMRIGADDGHLVGVFGHQRQLVAELDARHDGIDRIKQTANAGRWLRLEVEHILLRRSAPQVKQDARFGFSAGSRLGRSSLFGLQQPRQRQPP